MIFATASSSRLLRLMVPWTLMLSPIPDLFKSLLFHGPEACLNIAGRCNCNHFPVYDFPAPQSTIVLFLRLKPFLCQAGIRCSLRHAGRNPVACLRHHVGLCGDGLCGLENAVPGLRFGLHKTSPWDCAESRILHLSVPCQPPNPLQNTPTEL